MKTLTKRLVMFAATAVALGSAAYGQTMKADIPFAFRTANATLPAGTYTIGRLQSPGSAGVIKLWNQGTGQASITLSHGPDSHMAAEKPHLVFTCGDKVCSLSEIRSTSEGYAFAPPRKTLRDTERVSFISVPLKALNAD